MSSKISVGRLAVKSDRFKKAFFVDDLKRSSVKLPLGASVMAASLSAISRAIVFSRPSFNKISSCLSALKIGFWTGLWLGEGARVGVIDDVGVGVEFSEIKGVGEVDATGGLFCFCHKYQPAAAKSPAIIIIAPITKMGLVIRELTAGNRNVIFFGGRTDAFTDVPAGFKFEIGGLVDLLAVGAVGTIGTIGLGGAGGGVAGCAARVAAGGGIIGEMTGGFGIGV